MDDELEITASAMRRLRPWFDSDDEVEAWAVAQLIAAADEHRLLREPPARAAGDHPSKKALKRTLRYVESVGAPTDVVLLYEVEPSGVILRAAWPMPIPVSLTRHARERVHERMLQLEPDAERRRHWLTATVDIALRTDALVLEAPSWAASAPLRPGFGWAMRRLGGDEVALLVAAPPQGTTTWNIVTVLTGSTGITPVGRLLRSLRRGRRLLANRLRHGGPEPVRERATEPPRLGDHAPRVGRRRRTRR